MLKKLFEADRKLEGKKSRELLIENPNRILCLTFLQLLTFRMYVGIKHLVKCVCVNFWNPL